MFLFLCVLCCYTKFTLCDVVEQEGKRCNVACALQELKPLLNRFSCHFSLEMRYTELRQRTLYLTSLFDGKRHFSKPGKFD